MLVRNEGCRWIKFIWGHHPAIGKPFLSSECKIKKVKVVEGDGLSYTNLKQTEGEWPFVEGKDGKKVDISKVPSENDKVSDIIFLKCEIIAGVRRI